MIVPRPHPFNVTVSSFKTGLLYDVSLGSTMELFLENFQKKLRFFATYLPMHINLQNSVPVISILCFELL